MQVAIDIADDVTRLAAEVRTVEFVAALKGMNSQRVSPYRRAAAITLR
jgi:hypothetical protein